MQTPRHLQALPGLQFLLTERQTARQKAVYGGIINRSDVGHDHVHKAIGGLLNGQYPPCRWPRGGEQRRAGPKRSLEPYPAEPMTMWPISIRVSSPNDDPEVLKPVAALWCWFGSRYRICGHSRASPHQAGLFGICSII